MQSSEVIKKSSLWTDRLPSSFCTKDLPPPTCANLVAFAHASKYHDILEVPETLIETFNASKSIIEERAVGEERLLKERTKESRFVPWKPWIRHKVLDSWTYQLPKMSDTIIPPSNEVAQDGPYYSYKSEPTRDPKDIRITKKKQESTPPIPSSKKKNSMKRWRWWGDWRPLKTEMQHLKKKNSQQTVSFYSKSRTDTGSSSVQGTIHSS
jgi:hypothetical protein